MNYYFLLASLPAFLAGELAPVSMEEFLARCDRELSPADRRELDAVLLADEDVAASCFAREWFRHERHIRNAIVHVRATRHGVDPGPWLRPVQGIDGFLAKAVGEAMARPNPLERELALDKVRWQALDDLAIGHDFDLAAVLIYALRLQLALRLRGLTVEDGHKAMKAFVVRSGSKAGFSEFRTQRT